MTCDESEMYPGQIITYTIKPVLGIPLEWVTEITHVDKYHYFIDEQRSGPYKIWHHEHRFMPIPKGVEMHDTIYYQLPFGPIGRLVNRLKVQRDIEAIFAFRETKMIELFGKVVV
jgi:ligand-binding SRPBCC domain-containing protein